MVKVIVLMSTYNGSKYLEEQIDSILSQIDVNVSLLVRDDGSYDDTVRILKQYSGKDERVRYYEGNNIGYTRSFLNLISVADNADYYAFSDQDDVWDSDKLICAVRKLKSMPGDGPLLYCSNARITDEKLHYFRNVDSMNKDIHCKYMYFAEGGPQGATEVFNKKLLDFLRNTDDEGVLYHDNWVGNVCSMLGEVCYDFEPHMYYRQHNNNAIGICVEKPGVREFISEMTRIMRSDLEPGRKTAEKIYRVYHDVLSDHDRMMLIKLMNYKHSGKSKIELLKEKEIHAHTFMLNILYCWAVILGKL